jgi:hypothetical protein
MMHHVIDHVVPNDDLCQTSFMYLQIVVAPPWSVASLLSSDLSDEALAKSEALAKEDARPQGSHPTD